MGIYLPNMEMPTKGYRLILIHADGTAQSTDGEMTVAPVPPHGDLIDRDETMNAILEERGEDTACWFAEIVNEMPTIIEAEEEE